MSAFKPQQRHLTVRDREFHFVAYEGSPTKLRAGQEPYPAMWYLMVEGRRCPALLFDSEQDLPQVDEALCAWAEDNAIGSMEPAPAAPKAAAANRRYENWWGPN